MKFLSPAALVLLLAIGSLAADTPQPEEGFVSLFDGKTLDGWKVGENADVFQVRDGMIVMECPATTHSPAHLFYVGDVNHHDFKNFDLKVDVMTFPKANSGIYFHTKYQEAGWPKFGTRMPGRQQPRRLAPDGQPVGHQEHLVGPGNAAQEQQGRRHHFAEAAGHGQRLVYPRGHLPERAGDGQARRQDHVRVQDSRCGCPA